MELPPNTETTGLRSARPLDDTQAVRFLGGQDSGSQDGWIPQPSPSNTRQPSAYPANIYQPDLPDMTTHRMPVIQPIQGSGDPRAAVGTLSRTSQDHTIALDSQGSRNLIGSANPSENRQQGITLGSSFQGYADTRAAAQHFHRQSRGLPHVRILVNTARARGRGAPRVSSHRGHADNRAANQHRPRQGTPRVRVSVRTFRTPGRGIPTASSHRGHADSGAAPQRQADQRHTHHRANTSHHVTRGTRRGREPRILQTHRVLVREGGVDEMARIARRENGGIVAVGTLRRDGWVVSSIGLLFDATRRVERVRVVYYRILHS